VEQQNEQLTKQLGDLAAQYAESPSEELANRIVVTFKNRMRVLGASEKALDFMEGYAMNREILRTVMQKQEKVRA